MNITIFQGIKGNFSQFEDSVCINLESNCANYF